MKAESKSGNASRLGAPMTLRAVPPFAALRAFEAVGRLGGIRKAAHSLALDNAVVSRHIRALEAWVGASLFDRAIGTRPSLTPAGRQYHRRISAAIQEIALATSELAPQDLTDRVVIWSNGGFAAQWLSRQITAFGAAHEGLEIELRPTDEVPDLIQVEADIDVRYYGDSYSTKPNLKGIRYFEFARPPIMAVASPSWAASNSPNCCVENLLDAHLLHEEHDEQWRAWFVAQGAHPPERISGPRLWHAHIALAAAIRGEGVALASSYLVGDDMAQGRLVEIVPTGVEPGGVPLGGYVFSAREDRWNLPVFVRLRQWLQKAAKS